ncbi:MAG: outer membrane beta-barrel protein [Nitrospirota bacterium]|nr:outer membrane beta-barrel protein [Nitrospirota bacterium]
MKSMFGVWAITLGIFLFTGTPANAEWYVGGQVGFVKPNDLKNVEGVDSAKGIELSDSDLKNALGYGMKVGYFFPDYMDWLGLQFEVFTSNPHIKQQSVTASTGGSSVSLGTVDGSHLRIITPAVNVIFRFPGYSVEPYLGPGIGAFWAHLSDSAGSDNDIAPGVNALGGLRFYVNEEVALFTEYKYNYTKFKFTDSNFKATYSSHSFFGGLSYHF